MEQFQVVGLHGFNNRHGGKENLDKLYPHLTWADVTELDRDWDGLLEARWELKKEAARVKREVFSLRPMEKKVVLVGHSHGCNIIREAMQDEDMWKWVSACILFNPAVRPEADFHVPTLCFYSKSDPAVKASLALRFLPWNWIWQQPWGDAGAKGLEPLGGRTRENIDEEELTGDKIVHSNIFATPARRKLCNRVIVTFLQLHAGLGSQHPQTVDELGQDPR